MTEPARIIKTLEEPVGPRSVVCTHGLFNGAPAYVSVVEVLARGLRVRHTGIELRITGTWLSGVDGAYYRVESAEPWRVLPSDAPRRRRSRPQPEEVRG